MTSGASGALVFKVEGRNEENEILPGSILKIGPTQAIADERWRLEKVQDVKFCY